jgi:6-pyruvoyltetrahydropterin/6-carboxytetrahydropterin synthase
VSFDLIRSFRFEAAHSLPRAPEGHKCRRLHGHSFLVDVQVTGQAGDESGWVIDFGDIDALWAPLHDELDHRYLNEISGLDNPTSENIARWIWERLEIKLVGLTAVTVRETCDSAAVYRG